MKCLLLLAVAVPPLFFPSALAAAEPLTLFDFRNHPPPAGLTTNDALAEVISGEGLRVATGRSAPWPGVTLPAPGGAWDLSAFSRVELHLRNTGTNAVTVFCRVDNPGADGADHCVTGSTTIPPGATGAVQVALTRASGDTLGGKLFGMRDYPLRPGGPRTVDPARITQVLAFVAKPTAAHRFTLTAVRAAGTYVRPTAWSTDAEPFFPFIDAFGQYRHRDWPGKVHSLAELHERREQEAKELAARPGPADWNPFGGWAAGPKLAATGFFRTEKHRGKWWLVDPEGRLFFSHGVDCVRMFDATPIEERAAWFEDFPGDAPEFREFLWKGFALKGHYAGRSPQCFSFAGANLLRKYGAGWNAAYASLAHQRLRSWGLNTIANWSDAGVCRLRRTPYTDTLGSHGAKQLEGSEGYWGKFPDVFDPSFSNAVRRAVAGKPSAGDPWCLGYFSDNEMSWGDEVSLAVAALQSPPDQAAKREFLADLRGQYEDIARLNAAWGASHDSWKALGEACVAPDRHKARTDLAAFSLKTARTYFRTVRDALKAVAPNQLYLGCRFAWVNEQAARAAAEFCDVVSYNLYQRSIADFHSPGADKPLLIGEFHFGALDRGLFHTGLVPVESQAARAAAYENYVRGALTHPQFVGTHWFQWQDEPTTGRVYDEENYQIGLLDIADTPYAETIAATRRVGAAMYRLRAGE